MKKQTKYSRPNNKHIDIKAVKHLLAERGERGWTIARLAKRIGYSKGHVHNALVGTRKSFPVIEKIAQEFGVPVNSLLIPSPIETDSSKAA